MPTAPLEPIWPTRAEADLLREFTRREEAMEASGVELIETVDSAIRLLKLNLEMAPVYSAPYRRLLLKDRRLGMFYTVETRGLIIHAVSDLRQDRATILRHLGT